MHTNESFARVGAVVSRARPSSSRGANARGNGRSGTRAFFVVSRAFGGVNARSEVWARVETMGNKSRLMCATCGTAYKRYTGCSPRFCKQCRAAGSTRDDAETLETNDDGAFIGFKRSNDAAIGECDDAVVEAARVKSAAKGGGAGGKKKRKKKKAPTLNPRTDPQCAEILAHLDATCVVIDASNADAELQPCVEALKQAEYIAVDCEGVRMSRTGPVTVLQCGTRDRLYLLDVQSLGKACFGDRGAGGVRDVLESKDAPIKLMFDCRMDSDALFHQFDVRLENVMDAQVLDVATRRSLGKMIDRVSGIAKCTGTYLTSVETAVAADLKVRVKQLYAAEESTLWAERPMTDDVRRYAALDVWLLIKLYEKMMFDLRDDEDDWVARTFKESARRVLAFRELEVAMEQGVFTEESTVAPTF